MKAWRFYGFNDMRLDDVPMPECPPGHVIAQVLCVQPSVTEAQLAFGIPTLAYEKIKRRLETEAPVQLFGHEFCVRIVETGEGRLAVQSRRTSGGAREAAMSELPDVPQRSKLSLPQGPDHRIPASGMFRGVCCASRNRAGQGGRQYLG